MCFGRQKDLSYSHLYKVEHLYVFNIDSLTCDDYTHLEKSLRADKIDESLQRRVPIQDAAGLICGVPVCPPGFKDCMGKLELVFDTLCITSTLTLGIEKSYQIYHRKNKSLVLNTLAQNSKRSP